jgi:thiol-disulfide isomerase/thioredoxin
MKKILIVVCSIVLVFTSLHSESGMTSKEVLGYQVLNPRVNRNFALEKFVQDKGLILSFWMPSCIPCKAEMPALQKFISTDEGKGINLVFLSTDMSQVDEVNTFIDSSSIPSRYFYEDVDLKLSIQFKANISVPLIVLFRKSDLRYCSLPRDEKHNFDKNPNAMDLLRVEILEFLKGGKCPLDSAVKSKK